MRNSIFYISWISFLLIACHFVDEKKTNILFVISDDQSYPHAGIYGTEWINTPGFDRVAREGLLFTQAFTTNAKCSPSIAISPATCCINNSACSAFEIDSVLPDLNSVKIW